jgi:hypothetical protein
MLAEQFADVFAKYNNTALQLQATHSPQPDAESQVRLYAAMFSLLALWNPCLILFVGNWWH